MLYGILVKNITVLRSCTFNTRKRDFAYDINRNFGCKNLAIKKFEWHGAPENVIVQFEIIESGRYDGETERFHNMQPRITKSFAQNIYI